MSEGRRYTVAEIDRMRSALATIIQPQPMMPYNLGEHKARIEDLLRTYMLNGTGPDELEAQASERWQQIIDAQEKRTWRDGSRGGIMVSGPGSGAIEVM